MQVDARGFSCVFFDPEDDTRAVAGGFGLLFYSTERGKKDSWKSANTPAFASRPRIQLSYAMSDSSIVFACVDTAPLTKVWKSTDGGVTFSARPSVASDRMLGKQGYYDNALWAYDGNLVVVGGINLWRSADGGGTFSEISSWSAAQTTFNSAHADHHEITPHPGFDNSTNKTVFFGNDGGIYKADDVTTVSGTNGWTNLNNGYAVTQFARGAGNARDRIVIGGAQDNGTQAHTSGNYYWDRKWVWLGDGTLTVADPTDSSIFYGAYPMLTLFRAKRTEIQATRIGGVVQTEGTWDQAWLSDGIPGAGIGNRRAEWTSTCVLDPGNANVMYAGGLPQLWRSSNVKAVSPQWVKIRNAGTANITAVAVANSVPGAVNPLSDSIIIGQANGEIWRTTNANIQDNQLDLAGNKPKWDPINNNITAQRRCEYLNIDRQNPNIYYACFGGYQAGNLWRTTDSGGSWSDISNGLPKAPVYCLAIHPQNSGWIYAATEVGLFASEDAGLTWSANNEGPANVSCRDLFWLDTTLVCVTYGRGMFQIDLTIRGVPKTVLATDMHGTIYAFDGAGGAMVHKKALPGATALTGINAVMETRALRDTVGKPLADALKNTGYAADSNGVVYCVDTQTLDVTWQVAVGGGVAATPELWLHPNDKTLLLLVSSNDGRLTAFDLSKNHIQAWSIMLPGVAGGEIVANTVMDNWAYVTTSTGIFAVRLLGGTQPVVAWSDTSIQAHAPSTLIHGNLYVPTEDGLNGYDARTGTRLWQGSAGGGKVTSRPVFCLGAVVFGNETGTVLGVNAKDGEALFDVTTTGNIVGLAADDNVVYFVNSDFAGKLHRMSVVPGVGGNPWSFTEEWHVDVMLGTNAPPVVIDTEDKLYLTTVTNEAKCLSTDDGSEVWTASLDNMSFAMMAPVWPAVIAAPVTPAGTEIVGEAMPDESAVDALRRFVAGPQAGETPPELPTTVLAAMSSSVPARDEAAGEATARFSAPAASGAGQRPAIAVAMATDTSGSMRTGTWEANIAYMDYAKTNAASLIYMFQPNDYLGLVRFSDTASVIYPASGNTAVKITGKPEQTAAAMALGALQPNGYTNIYDAIQKSAGLLQNAPTAQKAIVLLSDGKQEGVSAPDPATNLPAATRIFTIALGPGGDTAKMMQIAQKSGGTFQQCRTAKELQVVYNAIVSKAGVAAALKNDLVILPPFRAKSTGSVNVAGGRFVFLLVHWEQDGLIYTPNPPRQNEVQITITVDDFDELPDRPYEVGKRWALFKINNPVAGSYEATLWVGSNTSINATIGVFDPKMLLRLNAAPASPLVMNGQQRIDLAAGINAGSSFLPGARVSAVHEQPVMSLEEAVAHNRSRLDPIARQAEAAGTPMDLNAQLAVLQDQIGDAEIIPYRKQGVSMARETVRGEEVHTAGIDTSNLKPGVHIFTVNADVVDPETGDPVTLTDRVTVVVG